MAQRKMEIEVFLAYMGLLTVIVIGTVSTSVIIKQGQIKEARGDEIFDKQEQKNEELDLFQFRYFKKSPTADAIFVVQVKNIGTQSIERASESISFVFNDTNPRVREQTPRLLAFEVRESTSKSPSVGESGFINKSVVHPGEVIWFCYVIDSIPEKITYKTNLSNSKTGTINSTTFNTFVSNNKREAGTLEYEEGIGVDFGDCPFAGPQIEFTRVGGTVTLVSPNTGELKTLNRPGGNLTTYGINNNNQGIQGIGSASYDLDRDGIVDVPVIDGNNFLLTVEETGQQTTLVNSGQLPKQKPISTSDFDNDGVREVFFINNNGRLEFADAVTGDRVAVSDSQTSGGAPASVPVGQVDLDDDGDFGILYTDSNGKFAVIETVGGQKQRVGPPGSKISPSQSRFSQPGDIDDDSFTEVAAGSGGSDIVIYEIDPDSPDFGSKRGFNVQPTNPQQLPIALVRKNKPVDFVGGDGIPDLIFTNNNDNNNLYALNITNGNTFAIRDFNGSKIKSNGRGAR